MNNRRITISRLILFAALIGLCIIARAQQPMNYEYVYDGNGQLLRAIDSDGNVLTYTYDASGNLLSVTRGTTADLGPPVITTITDANSVTIGTLNEDTRVVVELTGNNLLAADLTTDNSGIEILGLGGSDTLLNATLAIARDAPLGVATLTVTTSNGTVSITLPVLGPLPRVSALSPAVGVSSGGTAVVISGTDLTPGTTISIGGEAALGTTFVDANTMTAFTPAGTPGRPADVEARNANGATRLAGGFTYTFPFNLPGALALASGSTGSLNVKFTAPVSSETTLSLISSNPTIAAVPASFMVPVAAESVAIPVTAGALGTSTVSVNLGPNSLSTTVFVSPPFSGTVDLATFAVGMFVTPAKGVTLAPVVGAQITPALLQTVGLSSGTSTTVSVPLAAPAPPGGLSVSLVSSDPALASVPPQVVIAEGEQSVSFTITGNSSGQLLVSVSAGGEVIQLSVLVDQAVDLNAGALAPVVGAFVTPSKGITVAPTVGTFVTPSKGITVAPTVGTFVTPSKGVTLAPIVGVEVRP